MQVAVYIRVSTEEQAKEGYSISAQRERLEAFVKSQGWMIVEYYIEEGQSAKDLNRPEIQRLITDIKKKEMGIEVVLVYRLDRLTRSVLDLYALLKLLEENKVFFKSATEVYDTTTAIGRLFITLVAALAQWERENLGERVRMGMAEMARQGRRPGSKEPYGYNYTDGRLVINPTEAAIVKKIFEMYSRGYGVRKVVAWLNNPNGPIPSKNNGQWADSSVSYIITNPLYIGRFAWGREEHWKHKNMLKSIKPEHVYQGSHEPIIDEETWETVQMKFRRKRKMPPRHSSSNYPLTGILACGLCGDNMNGTMSTSKSLKGKKKVRYYKCSRRDHKQTCDMKYMKSETVEETLLEYIDNLSLVAEFQDLINEGLNAKNQIDNTEEDALNAELKEVSAKKKKWYDAYEAGVIELRDLRERAKIIADKEVFIRNRLAEIQPVNDEPVWTPEERMEKTKKFRLLWDEATPEERKELAHELIKKVSITPDGNITVQLH